MDTIKLKNGAAVSAAIVEVHRRTLQALIDSEDPLVGLPAVCDLYRLAHDHEHQLSSQAVFDLLARYRLLKGTPSTPTMQATTRDIVMCAVKVETVFGMDVPVLVSPYAERP